MLIDTPPDRAPGSIATTTPGQLTESRGLQGLRLVGKYGTPAVLLAEIIYFGIVEGATFLSADNLINILVQAAIPIVVALGLTAILLAGEFDLSLGNNVSLACVLTATWYTGSPNEKALALLAIVAVGALVGLINGLVVTKLGVNALVATLGVGSLVTGVNYLVTGGSPLSLKPDALELSNIFLDGLGSITWVVLISGGAAALLWVILNRTTLGLEIKAVGGNRVASELSGIRVHRVLIIAFMIGGAFASFGGILLTANVGSGNPSGGEGYLLASYAACFLGAAVVRDGEFHTLGTVTGVITLAVGFNGLALNGVGTSAQYFFQGALLILAVGMSTVARRISTGRRVGH